MRVRNMAVGVIIGTTMGAGISRGRPLVADVGHRPRASRRGARRGRPRPGADARSRRGRSRSMRRPMRYGHGSSRWGYGRAGWYSYDTLDNRGQERRADRARLAVDRRWRRHAAQPGWRVRGPRRRTWSGAGAVVRHRTARKPDGGDEGRRTSEAAETRCRPASRRRARFLSTTPKDFAASWAFVLEPLDGGRTRFIERFRVRFGDAGPSFRVIGPVMGFGVFLMLRRQMLGIKARAERTIVVPPLPAAPSTPEPTTTEPKRPIATTGTSPLRRLPLEVVAVPAG